MDASAARLGRRPLFFCPVTGASFVTSVYALSLCRTSYEIFIMHNIRLEFQIQNLTIITDPMQIHFLR